ncbi:hypothetical protein [Desulfosporosinus hippei]|uniref:Uncharacterized protein n=1 Tax=Desulfosporosinus hippei DSM 8344 TaxID=1121419 RepID=A0A1G8FTW8_9FIRM|nr:hypothetical protein [Desulfosporosinus hippei]SDH85583.1 hypothetical protein SAMN05443529_12076 [Desulfosporosinus hippei DSM 8344]
MFTVYHKKMGNALAHMGGSMIVDKIRVDQPKNELLGQIWHMLTGIDWESPLCTVIVPNQ